jgi:hypothetical protein
LFYELTLLFRPLKYDRKLSRIKDDIKHNFLNPNDRGFIVFNVIYFAWAILGLLTYLWPLFLSIIVSGYLISKVSSNINLEKSRVRWRVIDSLFSIFFLLILIYIHYL